MGALTLKSFPFELRGWDLEEFETIDPTDGFGSTIRVYLNKNQIVQIESDYDNHTSNTWITDKGRHFFDGIFNIWDVSSSIEKLVTYIWLKLFKNLTQNIYVFSLCNNKLFNNYFFTIVFENISLEVLSLLNIISHSYFFIKIRKAENIEVNNDLESNFQLNGISNKINLNNSDTCLLISTNTRYQGYRLNLNLRQRFFKGNFRCILMGSLIDLTFPIAYYLGSNIKILKDIVEGNNFNCFDLIESKNPLVVINDELLKRNDDFSLILKYNWNKLNILNSSLNTTGNISLSHFLSFNSKDLINFSSLYLINVPFSKLPNIKKIIKLKFLNYTPTPIKKLKTNKLIIDQNLLRNNDLKLFYENCMHFYLPIHTFFENNEAFVNTEGFIKRTSEILSNEKSKTIWQVLRKSLQSFTKKTFFLLLKDDQITLFNCYNQSNFKNLLYFYYCATKKLANLNYYFITKNKPFFIIKKKFKLEYKKIYYTKLKYWLDDFFTGGKDDYSQNSLVLINCSKITRTESTNFF